MDLVANLRSETLEFRYRLAIDCIDGPRFTFRALWDEVDVLRRRMRGLGVSEGRLVSLEISDDLETIIFMLACLSEGASVRILPSRSKTVTSYTPSHFLVTDRNSVEGVEPVCRLPIAGIRSPLCFFKFYNDDPWLEDDPELLLQSSGSTGPVKTARLTSAGCWYMIQANSAALALTCNDRTLQLLPLAYSYGLIGQFLSHLVRGALTVITTPAARTHLNVSALSSKYQISTLMLVPGVARLWSAHNSISPSVADLRTRLITVGGDPMDAATLGFLRNVAPAASIAVTYGLVEAGPRVCTGFVDAELLSRAAVGRPLDGVEVEIEDEILGSSGQLFVRSPALMRAYLEPCPSDPLANRPGWLATGDLASIRGGTVFLHGRIKNKVNVDGTFLQLEDIERWIYSSGRFLEASARMNVGENLIEIGVRPVPGIVSTDFDLEHEISNRFSIAPSYVRMLKSHQIVKTA